MARALCAFSRAAARSMGLRADGPGLAGAAAARLARGQVAERPAKQPGRAVRIDVADRDDDGTPAAHRLLVPAAHVVGVDGRRRLRQSADRKPVSRSPKRGPECELERVAEHVVHHLLRLGNHAVTAR